MAAAGDHRLRVVLDTNVLVSGFAYPDGVPYEIVKACLSGGLRIVLTGYIVDETARVLPRFKQFEINADEAQEVLGRLVFGGELVEPVWLDERELRDTADQPVLGTLVASGAAYLITGDKDLLALAGKYPVVTPAEFWKRHG